MVKGLRKVDLPDKECEPGVEKFSVALQVGLL